MQSLPEESPILLRKSYKALINGIKFPIFLKHKHKYYNKIFLKEIIKTIYD